MQRLRAAGTAPPPASLHVPTLTALMSLVTVMLDTPAFCAASTVMGHGS